jgi:hypothetical protein
MYEDEAMLVVKVTPGWNFTSNESMPMFKGLQE